MHVADRPLAHRQPTMKVRDFIMLNRMILNEMMMLRVAREGRPYGAGMLSRPTGATVGCGVRSTLHVHFVSGFRGKHGGAPDAPGDRTTIAIDYLSPRSILTATILGSERHPSAPPPVNTSAFRQRIPMSDANAQSVESRIAGVVQRLLAEHSIDRAVAPDDDLRLAGLSSLDMVSLVLSIEEEFDFMVPESSIMPSNFRSISTIGRLVGSLQKNA